LYFLPLPQGQGSFLPVFIVALHHEGARHNQGVQGHRAAAPGNAEICGSPFGAVFQTFMP
jgi:hypothetical protein